MIQILNNQYPIGWEWIANIPLSQMKFFYDLMATVTDNTDIYSSLQCERMESYPYLITKILCVDRIKLAQFLNDNQDKAYQELIDQVNATYGDGGILHFKSMKGIKNYFEHVTIETQELTSTGFKTAILNRETK